MKNLIFWELMKMVCGIGLGLGISIVFFNLFIK